MNSQIFLQREVLLCLNYPENIFIETSERVLYSLSLRERVGVRDSQNEAIDGVSLLLASSLREEQKAKSIFISLFYRLLFH
jgi:hypothetical protein